MLLLAVVALGIPLALSLRDRVDAEVRDQARSEANVVAASAVAMLGTGERHTLDRLTQRRGPQRPRPGSRAEPHRAG